MNILRLAFKKFTEEPRQIISLINKKDNEISLILDNFFKTKYIFNC